MARYDVYGIGNALVDMEYAVTPEELQTLGVEKGVMTLIEEDRQADLLEKLWREPKKKACGGSAANTVIAVSQLGGKSYYSCKVASDDTGEFYYKDLLSNGVATNLQPNGRPAGVTGKCLVFITPDADRTLNTFLGITSDFSESEVVEDAIRDSQYVYVEGYLVPSPTGRAAAIRTRELAEKHGVRTAVTLSDPNMVAFFKDGLKEIIGAKVDLLFANESEALKYFETSDLDRAVEGMKGIARNFAITLGPKGALVFDGKESRVVPTDTVKAIDTNGAGDLFAGSYLYGITHGMTPFQAAQLANRASGRLIQEYGPRLRAEELRALL